MFIGGSSAVLAGGLIAGRLFSSEPTYELLVGCYDNNLDKETFSWKKRDLEDFRRLTNPGRITYPNGEIRIGRRAFEMVEPQEVLPAEHIEFRKTCVGLDRAFNEEITRVLTCEIP